MTVTFRQASAADAPRIAALHASSWRATYRGILSDEYLDRRAEADRLALWTQRFAQPDEKLIVHVAHEGSSLRGFACVFLHAHPVWGALLDNLHVAHSHQGRGLGRKLLEAAAASCAGGIHLLVFERNEAARRFYERLGAREIERIVVGLPGGGTTVSVRYGWPVAADVVRFSVRRTSS